MRRVIEKVSHLSTDDGYLSFQNELTQSFYSELGQGYSQSENEVTLVKRLVDVAQGQNYGPVRLHTAMLHGSRSYVEFNYMDKPVTKELGDMAIIGLITSGSERLFQRTCIIQNKKASGSSWSIDLEQLFLLKNFPPLSGNKGMLKGCRDLSFRNSSGALGAFGLMTQPGEMIICTAPILSGTIGDKKSISRNDLSLYLGNGDRNRGQDPWALPFSGPFMRFHPKEWLIMFEEVFHHYGFPFLWATGAGRSQFFGNDVLDYDIYDFVRSWTQFSLGEITVAGGTVTNSTVDAFSNYLIRTAGFGGIASFPPDNIFGDMPMDSQFAVMVVHLDVEL